MFKGYEILVYPLISSAVIIVVLRYFHILVPRGGDEWFATVFIMWVVIMVTIAISANIPHKQ